MSDDALFDWGTEGEPKSETAIQQERRDEAKAWREAAEKKLIADLAKATSEIDAIRNEPQGEYTWLWIGELPKTWKTKAKELTGQRIGDDQHLRVVSGRIYSPGTHYGFNGKLVKASSLKDITILRLTATQATMAKLRKTGKEYVIEDDDGKLWKHYALVTRKTLANTISHRHTFGDHSDYTIMICDLAKNLGF